MNKKISVLLKILVVISIMFHFMYFANYTWSNTASSSAQELSKMHYTRGVKLYKQAEYDMAIRELESALYIDPAHKKAKKYLAAARKKRDKNIVTKLYKVASSYYKQKDYAKALGAYEKVLEVIPNDGYALYKSELLKAKIEKLDRIAQSSKYKMRAQELERLEREGLASRELLAKAQEQDQEHQEMARVAEQRRRRDIELAQEKRRSEIAQDLEKVEGVIGEDERISLAAISVAPEANEESRTREDLAEPKPQAAQGDKVNLPAISVAPQKKEEVSAAQKLDELERAMAMKKKVAQELKDREIEKQSKSMYSLGKEYYSDRDYPRAISVFEKIIALEDPDRPSYSASAQKYISRANQKIEEQERIARRKAEKEKVIAKRLQEKERAAEIKSLYLLGKGYYGDKDYSRAIALFEQTIQLEKDHPLRYTSYAKKYIEKSNGKIGMAKEGAEEETREDKIKQVQASDDALLDEVIDMARETSNYKMGTEAREVSAYSPPSPALLIHQKLEMPVNMNFQDVDIVYILDYLAEATGANIVMSSAVVESERKVSIKVKDMTLKEAIRYVLKSVGLTHRLDKNVIWIATPDEIQNEEMETRIFRLRKGKGTFTEFSSPATGGVGLGSAAEISAQMNIKDVVEQAVSWPSGSRIVLDERLATLIVTNTPYNLELIDRILDKIDIEPIQVLIETRFLEVTVTDLSELGIDWQLNSELPIDGAGFGMVQGFASGAGSSFTDTTRSTEGFNFTYQGLLTKPQFQVVLHTLAESHKVKTLSAPRVTTLDNQMATMKIVDEWIYPTRYEFQIVQNDANGDGDFNDANETQYKNVPADFVKRDVGILLRVTPSVGIDDETITLTLIPEVSEGTAGFFSYAGEVTLPLFTSRNLSTSVVVKNGGTVVLGGLIKETQAKIETKVPFLGDLPWVGALFRKNTDTTVRKNLLIFVTASILSSTGNKVVLNKAAQPAVR